MSYYKIIALRFDEHVEGRLTCALSLFSYKGGTKQSLSSGYPLCFPSKEVGSSDVKPKGSPDEDAQTSRMSNSRKGILQTVYVSAGIIT